MDSGRGSNPAPAPATSPSQDSGHARSGPLRVVDRQLVVYGVRVPSWLITSIPGFDPEGRYRRVTGPLCEIGKTATHNASRKIARRRRLADWSV